VARPAALVAPVTLADLRARREEILRIAAENRATNVRVFGSVARGEATAESDIDFLIDSLPGHSLFDRAGLKHDLQDLLGVRVDVGAADELRERIRPYVLADAVEL